MARLAKSLPPHHPTFLFSSAPRRQQLLLLVYWFYTSKSMYMTTHDETPLYLLYSVFHVVNCSVYTTDQSPDFECVNTMSKNCTQAMHIRTYVISSLVIVKSLNSSLSTQQATTVMHLLAWKRSRVWIHVCVHSCRCILYTAAGMNDIELQTCSYE